jgi:hypothetical protein
MAKNKNRDRGNQRQDRSAPAPGTEESKSAPQQDHAEQAQSRIASPSDVARKGQKRFGHN